MFGLLGDLHRKLAVDQARSLGLLDPAGPGSFTHPDLSRLLYAHGKVITPFFKARPEDRKLDKATGELRVPRHEPDGHLHFQGDGEAAYGVKFVLVAVRTPDHRGRIILDTEWVPTAGGEAATAMESFARLAPLTPGAQGVLYDTALRGVHHQVLLRDLGWLPVNKVAAAKAGAKTPRKKDGRREEKSVHVEDKTITLPNGRTHTLRLYARGGALGLGELTDTGELAFTALRRKRTHRNADKNGLFRWYNDYELPEQLGGGTITVRLHGNDDDMARKLNRTENVRPIPLHRSRLRPAVPATQRRRKHQPRPGRHALPPTGPHPRPRPPAPQPSRLRARDQQHRSAPSPTAPRRPRRLNAKHRPNEVRWTIAPAISSASAIPPPTVRFASRDRRRTQVTWPVRWQKGLSHRLFASARPRSSGG